MGNTQQSVLLNVRTSGEVVVQVSNGVGLKCINLFWGNLLQHLSSGIVSYLYDVFSGIINAFLWNTSVQPITTPQSANGSFDMVYIHQTAPHNFAFGWSAI